MSLVLQNHPLLLGQLRIAGKQYDDGHRDVDREPVVGLEVRQQGPLHASSHVVESGCARVGAYYAVRVEVRRPDGVLGQGDVPLDELVLEAVRFSVQVVHVVRALALQKKKKIETTLLKLNEDQRRRQRALAVEYEWEDHRLSI